jgi:hypothetical protein
MTAQSEAEKLLALADRVERMTGASHGVDAEIHCLINGYAYPKGPTARDAIMRISHRDAAAYYTASLDAAMTLVPADAAHHFIEQQKFFRRSADYSWARVSFVMGDGFSVGDEARSSTPALAITAAALRARAALTTGTTP